MNQTTPARGRVGPVVVGCDGSWSSAQAVIAAARTARRREAPLTLLVVQRSPDHVDAARGDVETERARARSMGETGRALVAQTEPTVETAVVVLTDVHDPRLDRLADDAGVLVLGAYGAGGQVALSFGSTSDALSRAFLCPILLPHARVGESLPPATRAPTVVAAVRHDASAHQVVAVAATEAAERQAPLLLLHAVPMQDASELAAEQHWLTSVVAAAEVPSWLPHRAVVVVAEPVSALLDHVEPDDLLVVTTRGEGRLASLVSDSVTRALLDAGPCDVLVVSHGAAHAAGPRRSDPDRAGASRVDTELSLTDCWMLLRGTPVGRLGVVVGGRPEIFPVNHVVRQAALVFRTARGSKLDACLGQPVAYEIDGVDPATGDVWSVVVKGTARELRERDEIMRALRTPIVAWDAGAKAHLVQIDPEPGPRSVTGRRFRLSHDVADGRSRAALRRRDTPDRDHVPAGL